MAKLIEQRYLCITLKEVFGEKAEKEALCKEMDRRYDKYPTFYRDIMSFFYPTTKFHWKK